MNATGTCILFLVSFLGLSAQGRSDPALRRVIKKASNRVLIQYPLRSPTRFQLIPRKLGIFNGRQFYSKRSLNTAYKIRKYRVLGTYYRKKLIPKSSIPELYVATDAFGMSIPVPRSQGKPTLLPRTDFVGNPILLITDSFGRPLIPKTDSYGNPQLPQTDTFGRPPKDSNGILSTAVSTLPTRNSQSTSVIASTISNRHYSLETSVSKTSFVYIALGVAIPLIIVVIVVCVVCVIREHKRRHRQITSSDQ